MDNMLPLIVALVAFVFAASLIPMSKMKVRGKGVRIWRLVAMALLVAAAFLAMFTPMLSGK